MYRMYLAFYLLLADGLSGSATVYPFSADAISAVPLGASPARALYHGGLHLYHQKRVAYASMNIVTGAT